MEDLRGAGRQIGAALASQMETRTAALLDMTAAVVSVHNAIEWLRADYNQGLRDRLAMAALRSLSLSEYWNERAIAEAAYELADAMIAARVQP